jgi:hypothetical protein
MRSGCEIKVVRPFDLRGVPVLGEFYPPEHLDLVQLVALAQERWLKQTRWLLRQRGMLDFSRFDQFTCFG